MGCSASTIAPAEGTASPSPTPQPQMEEGASLPEGDGLQRSGTSPNDPIAPTPPPDGRRKVTFLASPKAPPRVSRINPTAHDTWEALEEDIISKRLTLVTRTSTNIFGGEAHEQPRIALALGGGGFRAMSAAAAVVDALCTELLPEETRSGKTGQRLWDTVSHVAGVSGSAWTLLASLCGTESSHPFHTDPLSDATPPSNLWVHGNSGFHEGEHLYKGLLTMTSSTVVNASSMSNEFEAKMGMAPPYLMSDLTIASVLSQPHLGKTFLERWSNFLGFDVLAFRASPETLRSIIATPSELQERLSVHLDAQLSSSEGKLLIESGAYPQMLTALVADNDKPPKRNSVVDGKSPPKRRFSWVELTPHFIRNIDTSTMTQDLKGIEFLIAPEGPKSVSRGSDLFPMISPVCVHHWMALAGSIFSHDFITPLRQSMKDGLNSALKVERVDDRTRGTSSAYVSNSSVLLGRLRDATFSLNIPFPLLMRKSGREFDIIVAVDNTHRGASAMEIRKLIDMNLFQLHPSAYRPEDPFPPGQYVRVFRGAVGHPTIIYVLGMCDESSNNFAEDVVPLRRKIIELRQVVLSQLIPAIFNEVSRVQSAIRGGTTTMVPLKVSRNAPGRNARFLLERDTPEPSPFFRACRSAEMSDFWRPLTTQLVVELTLHHRIIDVLSMLRGIERVALGTVSKPQPLLIYLEAVAADTMRREKPIDVSSSILKQYPSFASAAQKLGILSAHAGSLTLTSLWKGYYAAIYMARLLFSKESKALSIITRGVTPSNRIPSNDVVDPRSISIATRASRASHMWTLLAHMATRCQPPSITLLIVMLKNSFVRQHPKKRKATTGTRANVVEEYLCYASTTLVNVFTVLISSSQESGEVVRQGLASMVEAMKKIDGSTAVFRMAEAASHHPAPASMHVLDAIMQLAPSKVEGTKDEENFLRTAAVAYEEPHIYAGFGEKKERLKEYWSSRGVSINLRDVCRMAIPTAMSTAMLENPLPFQEMAQLIVSSTSQNASMFHHAARKQSIIELWRRLMHAPDIQRSIAEVCMKGGFYWRFLGPVIHTMYIRGNLGERRECDAMQLVVEAPFLHQIVVDGETVEPALMERLAGILEESGKTLATRVAVAGDSNDAPEEAEEETADDESETMDVLEAGERDDFEEFNDVASPPSGDLYVGGDEESGVHRIDDKTDKDSLNGDANFRGCLDGGFVDVMASTTPSSSPPVMSTDVAGKTPPEDDSASELRDPAKPPVLIKALPSSVGFYTTIDTEDDTEHHADIEQAGTPGSPRKEVEEEWV